MRIGLLCGGPSAERGISLNSARSAMDHLLPLGWEVIPFYCDRDLIFYRLDQSHLYSNTPSDFDFKLNYKDQLRKSEFISSCLEMDIVLPVIHGAFGEDGKLQELLEKAKIPYLGSSSKSCHIMFDKILAKRKMKDQGYETIPDCCICLDDGEDIKKEKLAEFFNNLTEKYVVVKPSAGGSSIGVMTATNPETALIHANNILLNKLGGKALIEPYCRGREFTIVVLQNEDGKPVALIPIEVHLNNGEEIFSFRNKYLPSNNVNYFCPPNFTKKEIHEIQITAEKIFTDFDMRDFSRLDGWLLDDGEIIFSDFNPIPDLEQTSFLFIQGSRIGLSHIDMLRYIVEHATYRYGIECPVARQQKNKNPTKIRVLFGGKTAERQVSLESGTNVWLKLLYTAEYQPSLFILTPDMKVWELPYCFALNQSTEEILAYCVKSKEIISILKILVPDIRQRLGLIILNKESWIYPRCMNLDQFCKEASEEDSFVFNALHGGHGEDGTIQTKFNEYGLAYNGSDVNASHLCMDKLKTGIFVNALKDPEIISTPKISIPANQVKHLKKIWNDAIKELKTENIIIKPISDGCSTGVARLTSANELEQYLIAIKYGQTSLKSGELTYINSTIELPVDVEQFILEPFIESVEIRIEDLKPGYEAPYGWIELTVGVLETGGEYHSLSPSVTIAEANILSVEEKFQGGTGVNLTPPPKCIITNEQLSLIKTKIEKVANALTIQGYARIDIFFNIETNRILLIEANTLPGLTPSTVIYHQALAEEQPLFPKEFLSKLVEYGIERRKLIKKMITKDIN